MVIEERIVNVLEALLPNLTIVLADRNGVEPKAPYLLVTTFPLVPYGQAERTYFAVDGKEQVTRSSYATVRVTLHAKANDKSHNDFFRFYNGLESSHYIYTMYQQDLNYLYCSDIIYTSAPVNGTDNFKRATLDLTFLITYVDTYDADIITTVKTKGTLDDHEVVDVEVSKP